jgi:outer membrane protein assembly factor BamE (lipoprotein component of BamABCDE complex)
MRARVQEMSRPAKAAALLAAASLLAACAASGVQVSEQQAQSFQVGKSTYAEVVGALGDPTTSSIDTRGGRIATYSYSAVSARPQNFIPYIGPFVGGYDTKASAVTFTFDNRGVLTNTTSSQTNVGTGANLAAGTSPARSSPTASAAQPR